MSETCKVCGGKLVAPERGPMPQYCSSRCRMRAHRMRAAGFSDGTPVEPAPVPRVDRKPTLEDVVRLVVEARQLAGSFHFASERADHKLRPMCGRISDAIKQALDEEGLP